MEAGLSLVQLFQRYTFRLLPGQVPLKVGSQEAAVGMRRGRGARRCMLPPSAACLPCWPAPGTPAAACVGAMQGRSVVLRTRSRLPPWRATPAVLPALPAAACLQTKMLLTMGPAEGVHVTVHRRT